MKWITYILLIVISTLALIPCSDGMECQQRIEQSSDGHSDHPDHCTPFCSCTCCGSITTLPTLLKPFQEDLDLGSKYLFHYKKDYSFDYLNSVWHPPISC